MKAYTRRRLIASAKLGLATVPFSVALRLFHGFGITPGSFLMGFGAGFTVGVAELFLFKRWLRKLPFPAHLAIKSIVLVLLIFVTFAVLNVLDVIIDGLSWAQYADAVFAPELAIPLLEGLGVFAFLLFFVHLDRLLGPGLLVGYVTGRYHRRRTEQRIFMFLDLKGSTTIAEAMDPDRYVDFLQHYFAEMSEPILATDAEIHKYVGDEIVLSWKLSNGLQEASCLKVFFLIEEQIRKNRKVYLRDYGFVPEFKAGVYAGEVITAQIGELKSEIAYTGDVLNVAARIQALCNELGHRLLVSTDLVDRLGSQNEYAITDLGAVALRGKVEPVRLSAVSSA